MSRKKFFIIFLATIGSAGFLVVFHFFSTAFIPTPKPFILYVVDAETGERIRGAEVLFRESHDWVIVPRYSGAKLEDGFYFGILNTLRVTADVHADGYYDLGAGFLGKEITPYIPNTIALQPIKDSVGTLPGNYAEIHRDLQREVIPKVNPLERGRIGCDSNISYGLDFSAYESVVTVTNSAEADVVMEDCSIGAQENLARFYAPPPGGIRAEKIDENGFFSIDEAPSTGYSTSVPIEFSTLYFVKTKEGHFVKFTIHGGISRGGVLPMWAYQPDGSRDLAVRVGSQESNTVCAEAEREYSNFYRDKPDLFNKESFSFCEF